MLRTRWTVICYQGNSEKTPTGRGASPIVSCKSNDNSSRRDSSRSSSVVVVVEVVVVEVAVAVVVVIVVVVVVVAGGTGRVIFFFWPLLLWNRGLNNFSPCICQDRDMC